jgi:hypothetical protein
MSLDELRTRVEEAERILRVACQIASHDLRDPSSAERAKDRIASLCNDVNELLPGLARSAASAEEADAMVEEQLRAEQPMETTVQGADEEEGEDGGEETEWDVDYDKLRAAIHDVELMSKFPEGERDKFRAMALQLLDAHDRHQLYSRVSDGFQRLEETTRAGAEEARKQLAIALTMESLKKKRLD